MYYTVIFDVYYNHNRNITTKPVNINSKVIAIVVNTGMNIIANHCFDI